MNRILEVAIIGPTNVGKSSLLNSLIGTKNSIVSPKPHTTRTKVLGAVNINDTQIVFIDTPGYIKDNGSIWAKHFIESVQDATKDVGVILIVLDAYRPMAVGASEMLRAFASDPRTIIAVNKVDLKSRSSLYEIVARVSEYGYGDVVYLVSSLTNNGIDDLRQGLIKRAVDGEWLFETNPRLDPEFFVSECVREKAFYCLYKEIPFYMWAAPTKTRFRYDKNNTNKIIEWYAEIAIVVPKNSHKRIVVGSGGDMIKRIGVAARAELEAMWGPGQLFLNVVVNDEWLQSPEKVEEISTGCVRGIY